MRGAGGAACDGAWHVVRARLHRRALQLQLDAGQLVRGEPPTSLLDDLADTRTPPTQLYIGGLPGEYPTPVVSHHPTHGCLILNQVIGLLINILIYF